MTSKDVVRKALIDRLTGLTVDGETVTAYWYRPTTLDTPCIFIMPDFPSTDYRVAWNSPSAEWYWVISAAADFRDEETAQEQTGRIIDAVVVALRSDDLNDALSALTRYVMVTMGGEAGPSTHDDGNMYQIDQVRVAIRA